MIRLRSALDRVRGSLFFVPVSLVVLAIVAAEVALAIDRRIADDQLPRFLLSSVDDARTMLATIAGAMITVVSVVFSLTLVAVQLASTQYSPRSSQSFLRDRPQQLILGIVLGTVTYCLLVLRGTQSAIDGGEASVPNISVSFALLLALISIGAILASIDRTARSMQSNEVIRRITDATIHLVRSDFPARDSDETAATAGASAGADLPDITNGDQSGRALVAWRSGWVRQIALSRLVASAPERTTLRLEASVGTFVVEGRPLVWFEPEPDDFGSVADHARRAIELGRDRTLAQDVEYGLMQLVDVVIRALSPGVNDPTTAREVVVHLTEVLHELFHRRLPPRVAQVDGRRLERPADPGHASYVRGALTPIADASGQHAAVVETLVRACALLASEAPDEGVREELHAIATHAVDVLDRAIVSERTLQRLRPLLADVTP